MITIHLAIYEGDIKELNFETKIDLIDYVKDLIDFNCIWLATNGDQENPIFQEIVITENIFEIINFIQRIESEVLFIQEYQSYEDAYAVALDMRETNPKCYSL